MKLIIALCVLITTDCHADERYKSTQSAIMDKHFQMFTQRGRDQIDNKDHIPENLQTIRYSNIQKFWSSYQPWLQCMDKSKAITCDKLVDAWMKPLDELVQLDKTIQHN